MELVVTPLVNVIAILAMATGVGLTAWWLVGLHGIKSRSKEHELPHVELPAHIHEVETGIPPVLVIFYVVLGVSMIAYVLSVWAFGVTYG